MSKQNIDGIRIQTTNLLGQKRLPYNLSTAKQILFWSFLTNKATLLSNLNLNCRIKTKIIENITEITLALTSKTSLNLKYVCQKYFKKLNRLQNLKNELGGCQGRRIYDQEVPGYNPTLNQIVK